MLDVVSSFKLLGIIILSDLKWNFHIKYIVTKAKRRLWYLRRLQKLGASMQTILEMYHKTTRSILEMGTPVFAGGLSKTNKHDFEGVQRQAFRIILRGELNSYEHALNVLEEKSLDERRDKFSLKFAKKSVEHPKMKHLFKKKTNLKTRNGSIFSELKATCARTY